MTNLVWLTLRAMDECGPMPIEPAEWTAAGGTWESLEASEAYSEAFSQWKPLGRGDVRMEGEDLVFSWNKLNHGFEASVCITPEGHIETFFRDSAETSTGSVGDRREVYPTVLNAFFSRIDDAVNGRFRRDDMVDATAYALHSMVGKSAVLKMAQALRIGR